MDLADGTAMALRDLESTIASLDDVAAADVLALIILATAPPEQLTPPETELLVGFCGRVGVVEVPSGPELLAMLDAYFRKKANPSLEHVAALVRAMLAEGGASEKAATAVGAAMSAADRVPVGQRVGDAGSLRMGVLGRFALSTNGSRPPGEPFGK